MSRVAAAAAAAGEHRCRQPDTAAAAPEVWRLESGGHNLATTSTTSQHQQALTGNLVQTME